MKNQKNNIIFLLSMIILGQLNFSASASKFPSYTTSIEKKNIDQFQATLKQINKNPIFNLFCLTNVIGRSLMNLFSNSGDHTEIFDLDTILYAFQFNPEYFENFISLLNGFGSTIIQGVLETSSDQVQAQQKHLSDLFSNSTRYPEFFDQVDKIIARLDEQKNNSIILLMFFCFNSINSHQKHLDFIFNESNAIFDSMIITRNNVKFLDVTKIFKNPSTSNYLTLSRKSTFTKEGISFFQEILRIKGKKPLTKLTDTTTVEQIITEDSTILVEEIFSLFIKDDERNQQYDMLLNKTLDLFDQLKNNRTFYLYSLGWPKNITTILGDYKKKDLDGTALKQLYSNSPDDMKILIQLLEGFAKNIYHLLLDDFSVNKKKFDRPLLIDLTIQTSDMMDRFEQIQFFIDERNKSKQFFYFNELFLVFRGMSSKNSQYKTIFESSIPAIKAVLNKAPLDTLNVSSIFVNRAMTYVDRNTQLSTEGIGFINELLNLYSISGTLELVSSTTQDKISSKDQQLLEQLIEKLVPDFNAVLPADLKPLLPAYNFNDKSEDNSQDSSKSQDNKSEEKKKEDEKKLDVAAAIEADNKNFVERNKTELAVTGVLFLFGAFVGAKQYQDNQNKKDKKNKALENNPLESTENKNV